MSNDNNRGSTFVFRPFSSGQSQARNHIITHQQISHFRVFLVNLLYRTPHLHKDFELCLILEGEVSVHTNNQIYEGKTGRV